MAEDPLAEFKRRLLRRPVILYATVSFLVFAAIVAAMNQTFDLGAKLFGRSTVPSADETAQTASTTAGRGDTVRDTVYLSSLPSRKSHTSEVLFAPQVVGLAGPERGRTEHYEHSIAVTVADRLCLARVTLDYDIPTGASSFHTTVGFEQATSANAEVRFQVFLDNVSAYDKTLSPFSTDRISLPLINVTRVRLLVFVTQCNRATGRAVWGDPRFGTT